ncbi:MAG: MFS transporter [Actinobacteria bacterium]|nr:MAG: MFS transporter [Actinomycetota bacterium]
MGSFDSLRYRNFRLLWVGAFLSNIGTWMQSIALAWFVFLLTRSAFWVSFVTFVNFVPTVLSPIGGVFTDRLDRKRILFVTQTFMMADAAVLATLAWLHHATLFAVLALTFGQGLAFAFNGPTWQAFVPSLVPSEAMVNAIALNSTQFSLARVIGPAIAGAIIAASSNGAALVFTVNAVSFLTVIAALGLMRTPTFQPGERRRVREQLRSGLAYTWRNRRIRAMIEGIAVVSFFSAPATALLPLFAADVYGRGADSYGSLAAALGLGSVAGALVLGRLGNRIGKRVIATAMVSVGAVLLVFGSTDAYPIGLVMMFLFGAAYLLVVSGTNSDIQLAVDDQMRGRVISIWVVAFGVAYPAGALLAGLLASAWGPQATAVVGAVACLAWGLGMFRWTPGPSARPALETGS